MKRLFTLKLRPNTPIARKLELLLQFVRRGPAQPVENCTDSLLGSFGSEPLTDYNYTLDLSRFAS